MQDHKKNSPDISMDNNKAEQVALSEKISVLMIYQRRVQQQQSKEPQEANGKTLKSLNTLISQMNARLKALKEGNLGEQSSMPSAQYSFLAASTSRSAQTYRELAIPGDGNCLYSAVALYVGQDQQQLRNRVADELAKNPEEYKSLLELNKNKQILARDVAYIRDGSKKRADQAEIRALMKILQRPIILVSPGQNAQHRILEPSELLGEDKYWGKGAPIPVKYDGDARYNAIVLIEEQAYPPESSQSSKEVAGDGLNREQKREVLAVEQPADEIGKERKLPSQEQRRATIDQLKTLSQEYQTLLQEEQELHNEMKKSRGGLPKGSVGPQLAKIQNRLKEINEEFAHSDKKLKVYLVDSEVADMTHEHSLGISKFAAANGIIVIWRPINKEAARKLGRVVNPYKGKGLRTKGKSAEFDPIRGDIPVDAALSKVALTDPDNIEKFRAINKDAIEQGEKEYEEIKASVTVKNYKEINDRYIVCKIPKQLEINKPDGKSEQYELYYVPDDNSKKKVMWDQRANCPLFIIKDKTDPDRYFPYKVGSKPIEFDWTKPMTTRDLGGAPKVVEIMAYRQYKKVGNDQLIPYAAPITADYDELVSAPRKIFPFHQNISIPTTFQNILYQQLGKPEEKLDREELAADFIYSYEETLKKSHREKRFHSTMGNVTEEQLVAKTVMKFDTEGATNHGPEVNNPFPEKFVKGDYAVHLTDGSVMILHDEDAICNFINEQRREGFPLDANPKWGWDVNDNTGELSIPAIRRFDWYEIHKRIDNDREALKRKKEKLSLSKNEQNGIILSNAGEKILEAKSLADDWHTQLQWSGNAPPSGAKHLESLKELAILEKQYNMGEDIIKTQVAIEKWRLEPGIVYSRYINNYGGLPTETRAAQEFRERVITKIQEKDKNFRLAERQKFEVSLDQQEKVYKRYVGADSFLTSQRENLKRQREENGVQMVSNTTPSSNNEAKSAAPRSQPQHLGRSVPLVSSSSSLSSSTDEKETKNAPKIPSAVVSIPRFSEQPSSQFVSSSDGYNIYDSSLEEWGEPDASSSSLSGSTSSLPSSSSSNVSPIPPKSLPGAQRPTPLSNTPAECLALRQSGFIASLSKRGKPMDSKQFGEVSEHVAVLEYAAMLSFGGEELTILQAKRQSLEELLHKRSDFEKIRMQQFMSYTSEKHAIEVAIAESIKSRKPIASESKSFSQQLHDQAKHWGLTPKDAERLGNCFFDSFLDQLQNRQPDLLTEKNITTQADLRKIACYYIVEHWEEYRDFVEGDPNKFIEEMADKREWAENIIISALV